METPKSRGCTLSRFEPYLIYLATNYPGKAAAVPQVKTACPAMPFLLVPAYSISVGHTWVQLESAGRWSRRGPSVTSQPTSTVHLFSVPLCMTEDPHSARLITTPTSLRWGDLMLPAASSSGKPKWSDWSEMENDKCLSDRAHGWFMAGTGAPLLGFRQHFTDTAWSSELQHI